MYDRADVEDDTMVYSRCLAAVTERGYTKCLPTELHCYMSGTGAHLMKMGLQGRPWTRRKTLDCEHYDW